MASNRKTPNFAPRQNTEWGVPLTIYPPEPGGQATTRTTAPQRLSKEVLDYITTMVVDSRTAQSPNASQAGYGSSSATAPSRYAPQHPPYPLQNQYSTQNQYSPQNQSQSRQTVLNSQHTGGQAPSCGGYVPTNLQQAPAPQQSATLGQRPPKHN